MADVFQRHAGDGPARVRAGLFPVNTRQEAQRGLRAPVDRGSHPLFQGGLVRCPTPRNPLIATRKGEACA
jgi:hypothetical protein